MRIVGLCGYARTGKDTAFAILPEPGWARYAFADPLKADIGGLPGMRGRLNWFNPKDKEAIRPLLVGYGAAARHFQPDYWVARTFRAIEQDQKPKVIITDVRYRNEVETILTYGGIVIRLFRDGCVPANQEEVASFRAIDTEFPSLPKVVNCGTPADLGRWVMEKINDHS